MKKSLRIIGCIAMIAVFAMLLTGCSAVKKAESAVSSAFDALKALEFEKAAQYIDIEKMLAEEDGSFKVDENIFMKNVFDDMDYEIITAEKIDKATVMVKAKITAVDMKPVMMSYFTDALNYAFSAALSDNPPSDEEMERKMEEIFTDCVGKDDLKTVTNEVDIKVVKVDKQWKIEGSEELGDALLGGLKEAIEDLDTE